MSETTKRSKPRPVRAWGDELGRAFWRECRASAKTRKVTVTLQFETGNPAPYAHRIAEAAVDGLNSVPGGTPSQAAEVRRLRRLLRVALCAAENYIAAMEPHEGECDEPEDQAVIWHARKHVAEVKAALRGRSGR